jgi:hypothetical protein
VLILKNVLNLCILLRVFLLIIVKERVDTVLQQFLHLSGVYFIYIRLVTYTERTFLKQCLLHAELLRSAVEHLLFIRLRSNQPVNLYFKLLADPMSSCDCLQVVLRVPVRVEDNNDPGFGEVDAKPASPGSEQKDPELVILVESLDAGDPVLTFDCACKHLTANLLELEIILNDFDHPFELAKHQHLVTFTLVLVDELVKQL